MSFFKNRISSLIAVTFFVMLFWGQSGVLFAQYTVNNIADLKTAFDDIAQLNGTYTVTITLAKTIDLTDNLPELYVPAGVTVNIVSVSGSAIDGKNAWRGLVVNMEDSTAASVNVIDAVFKNCVGGSDFFLNGSDLSFGNPGLPKNDLTIVGNISDISAAPGFDKWQKDEHGVYVLEEKAGGVIINEGNTVTLKGNNNYAGVTLIKNDAILIADGKTQNAIGNLSEVQIIGTGILQLKSNETIGFLSGDAGAKVEINGKTLTIAGDEDPEKFGKGINPATGKQVEAFQGTIVGIGELIKTGTGRLTLSGNSTGSTFTTTIYQGTIVLGDAKALGGGDVTIKNIDPTGKNDKLRNVIEANKNLIDADAVMNNFHIEKGTQYNAFVVGGANDIQFGNAGVMGGRISGGNLLVNMSDAGVKVILANDGFDGTADYVASLLNNYGETQIKKGTVVVHEYELTTSGAPNGTKGSTLGKGDIHAIGIAGDAKLSAGTNGMTISNNLVMEYGSALTLTNEVAGLSYTLTGNTSDRGGLIVALDDVGDVVTMTGNLRHTGRTNIENGKLIIDDADPANPRTLTTLYDLSSGADGKLEVTSGNLYANITAPSTYRGTIDVQSGELYKTGAGTWIFDRASTIIDKVNVNAGALQLDQNGAVDDVVLNGGGKLIVNDSTVELLSLKADSPASNVTINGNNKLILNNDATLMNTWSGGTDATVQFNGNTTLKNTSQVPSTWKGTMEVADNKTLTVNVAGGLGDAENAEVTLNTDSTLLIETNSRNPSQINQLNVNGDSFVQVNGKDNFITNTLNGGSGVTKEGTGTWTMLGDSSTSFTGAVELAGGEIHLKRVYDPATWKYRYDANWGSGALNVTGSNTKLTIDVGDGKKEIANAITLANTLDVNINDYSKTGSAVVFKGAVTGAGGINLRGNSTLVYKNGVNYSGATNIFSGTLDLQGASLGNIVVHNGATLTGTGTNTVGNMNFAAGSHLNANYSGGNLPQFTAGQVTIVDGAMAHIMIDPEDPAHPWNEGAAKTLITGTPVSNDMFWFTNNVLGQRTEGRWESGELKIWFADFDYTDPTFATTANTKLASSYLEAIVDNSMIGQLWVPAYPVETTTAGLLKALENCVLPGQYNSALLEIGGQINPSLVTAQVQTTTNLFQSISKQLYPIRHFTEPCNDGFAVSGGTMYRGQSVRSGWTGWASGLGIFGTTKGSDSSGTSGYDFNTYGMSLGIEPTSVMSTGRIGLFYAYNYTDIDTKTSIGSGQVNDHFVGAYGRYVDDFGYTSFVAGFGFDQYKTRREVTITGASGYSRASFSGWQGGLYVERGLNHLSLTRLGLQPYVGVQYLYIDTNAFDETGTNPYLLETNVSNGNSLRSNLGIRYARQICRVKRSELYLSGNVAWMHEFLDADYTMSSKWAVSANPSRFGVNGNSLGRDWAVLGVGLDWQLRQNLSVFGSYDLQANSRQTLNVGNVGARILW